jgi:hypothetical protein
MTRAFSVSLPVPELLTPSELVKLPVTGANGALTRGQLEFLDDEKWLDSKVEDIIMNSTAVDTEQDRKPPFAVIRATRGGKTRALLELTRALRARGVAAVYISFNGDTSFDADREGNDLLLAFEWRITHALRRDQGLGIAQCGAERGIIQRWFVPGFSAALLVDELNVAVGRPPDLRAGMADVWKLLKQVFLAQNRAFVFSSHVNETFSQAMCDFIANHPSRRPVHVLFPPLIGDPVAAARAMCKAGHFVTVERIALCGRAPALALNTEVVATSAAAVRSEVPRPGFAAVCLDASWRDAPSRVDDHG